jgi:hypothetical protein
MKERKKKCDSKHNVYSQFTDKLEGIYIAFCLRKNCTKIKGLNVANWRQSACQREGYKTLRETTEELY